MMVKRLFKIKDKEITKEEFYDSVLNDGVPYPTMVVIKAIFDRIAFYIKIGDISSEMPLDVLYRKVRDQRNVIEYLVFRFFHENVNKADVRCINVTSLIVMSMKDGLINFDYLESNAKLEFYRIFNEFRDMTKMNRMEKPEDVAMYNYCYNDAIATEAALKKMAEAKEALNNKYGVGNFKLITAHYCPDVERVMFQEPATIVFWKDGSKTVVKVQKGEKYDPEKGLAMAYVKRLLGNCYAYYDIFKKNLPKEYRKKAAKSKK